MCGLEQNSADKPRIVNGELCLPNGEYHKLTDQTSDKRPRRLLRLRSRLARCNGVVTQLTVISLTANKTEH